MDIRVSGPDVADVAFEVLDIHRVEADYGWVETDICFCYFGAVVVWSIGSVGGEVFLDAVEGGEELVHGFFVCVLGAGEAGFVDAVVDVVVGPVVCFFDLGLEGFGEEVDFFVFLGQEVVEFGVEHADDFGGFVTDYLLSLFVVEGWHGEAALVGGVDGEVDFAEVGEFRMEGVLGDVFSGDVFAFLDEAPA